MQDAQGLTAGDGWLDLVPRKLPSLLSLHDANAFLPPALSATPQGRYKPMQYRVKHQFEDFVVQTVLDGDHVQVRGGVRHQLQRLAAAAMRRAAQLLAHEGAVQLPVPSLALHRPHIPALYVRQPRRFITRQVFVVFASS